MTLLATEIHRHNGLDEIVLFAADRRISRGTQRDSEQPKIFQIPRLSAGIGYFGLAEMPASSSTEPMAVWLQRFLSTSNASTLADLARDLVVALNTAVPLPWRCTEVSGFHLCGFAAAGRPEFWYIRNCDDTPAQSPTGVYEAREDFQGRDGPALPPVAIQVYRNGDIRAHVFAWEAIDHAFNGLLTAPDFGPPDTREQYEQWIEFKMDIIAQFYERFCSESIIGRPVDVFSVIWSG